MQTNTSRLIDPRNIVSDLGLERFLGQELSDTSYRPTVFLCLGGTGVKTGHKLKKILRQYFDEKDMGVFQFLAIDTAPELVEEGEESFDAGDFIYLHSFNAAELIDHLDENESIARWWPGGLESPYRPTFSGDGAGRVRPVGRLVLFNYLSSTIMPRLKEKINRAQDINRQRGIGNNSLKVYIICSLAGGTGSGMALDLAYLSRMVGMEYQDNAYVTGVLVLDDPFIPLAKTENECAEFRANTYAALKEINHFSKTKCFKEKYNNSLSTEKLANGFRPFDIAYLLGIHNSKGQVLESMDALTDMIAAEIAIEIASPLKNQIVNDLDNVHSTEESIAGQPTAFSSFGFSELVFPIKGLSSWCSLSAYNDITRQLFFSNTEDTLSLEDDVINFMQTSEIDQTQGNHLFEQLDNHNGQPVLLPTLMHDEIKGVHENVLLGMMQRKESAINEFLSKAKLTISSNQPAVTKTFEETLNKEVKKRLTDVNKGPQSLPAFLKKLQDKVVNQRDDYFQNEKVVCHNNAQHNHGELRLTFENLEKALRLPDWLPGRDKKIQNLVSSWTIFYNTYLDACYQENLYENAIACSNSIETIVKKYIDGANSMLSEWKTFSELSARGAASESVRNQAQASEYSLMHSILDENSMKRLYREHTPSLQTPEEKSSFLNQFWELFYGNFPNWSLAHFTQYSQMENPPVQFYYFLGEYYYKKFEPVPLHERMQQIMPATWDKEIHLRYEQTVPFWNYSIARFSNEIRDNLRHDPRLVGYYGGTDDDSWKQFIQKATGEHINVVNNKNPHSIMFLNTAHGLPLFALRSVNYSMKPSYDFMRRRWESEREESNPIPLHISEVWEKELLGLQPIKKIKEKIAKEVTANNNGHRDTEALKDSIEI